MIPAINARMMYRVSRLLGAGKMVVVILRKIIRLRVFFILKKDQPDFLVVHRYECKAPVLLLQIYRAEA